MTTHSVLMTQTVPSPVGRLLLAWNDRGLFAVAFAELEVRRAVFQRYLRKNGLTTREAAAASDNQHTLALRRYFEGEWNAVADLPLVLVGTPFQLEVWNALRAIPPGVTKSYGALAEEIGHPGASRAVGTANNLNPISIIVPCHRVIGGDRKLVGYGAGIDNKRWLLEHEGAVQASAFRGTDHRGRG